jgi:LacI family transcriptional regulator
MPDAIFCVNDEMAIGALSALRHLNLNVPNDVGVVGFSNSTAGRYMNPSLTSIEQSGEEIGKTATEILIQTINNENNIGSTFIQNVIEPLLIIRESSNRSI